MKTILKTVLFFFIIFYLSGSFISASLNLVEWDNDIRLNIGYGVLICCVLSSAFIAIAQSNDEN